MMAEKKNTEADIFHDDLKYSSLNGKLPDSPIINDGKFMQIGFSMYVCLRTCER